MQTRISFSCCSRNLENIIGFEDKAICYAQGYNTLGNAFGNFFPCGKKDFNSVTKTN